MDLTDSFRQLAIAAQMGAVSMESLARAFQVYDHPSELGPYTSKLLGKKVKVDFGPYNFKGNPF